MFKREKITVSSLSPGLLKQCINSAPEMLRALQVIYTGRDRLNSRDAIKLQALVPGGVYNMYGPTKNTVISTLYNLSDKHSYVNGVPIGTAASNLGAYVIDALQQLVPVGVMGELVVTGDRLARGYTDPELDRNRFTTVNIDGQVVRAY